MSKNRIQVGALCKLVKLTTKECLEFALENGTLVRVLKDDAALSGGYLCVAVCGGYFTGIDHFFNCYIGSGNLTTLGFEGFSLDQLDFDVTSWVSTTLHSYYMWLRILDMEKRVKELEDAKKD